MERNILHRTFPINVGIIRGTTADPDGNITMEKEALTLEGLSVATAAHNSGGIVIVQVERVAERGTLNPEQVVPCAFWSILWWWSRSPSTRCKLLQNSLNPAYSL